MILLLKGMFFRKSWRLLSQIYKSYHSVPLLSKSARVTFRSSSFFFLACWFCCVLLLPACPSPPTLPPTPKEKEKDIVYYCKRILDMNENERKDFLSSKEGELFKEEYEERGYKYDERDVETFCRDVKDNSLLKSDKTGSSTRSRRRSYSGGSSRSPRSRPCPENGEFPSENRKLSYIRFGRSANQYTEYTHKKYRNINGNNPAEVGEAEDENGNTHGQDILLRSFFIVSNNKNILVVILDKELIRYETGKTYYLYLSGITTNNGERESRRLELNPGNDYTIYYWPPACDDHPDNSEKCRCQNPQQSGCLSGKPEDPNWNRDGVTPQTVEGLSSQVVAIFSTVTFQVFSAEIDSNDIDDYFQDRKQIAHITSEKNEYCTYYQNEEP